MSNKMNIRIVRRVCGVRGCKNKISFSAARSGEMGNSVIICPECCLDILSAIEEYIPKNDRETALYSDLMHDSVIEEHIPEESDVTEEKIEDIPEIKPKRGRKKADE